jgi:hypothetical protein
MNWREELYRAEGLLKEARKQALRWTNDIDIQRTSWDRVEAARALILEVLHRLEDDHR